MTTKRKQDLRRALRCSAIVGPRPTTVFLRWLGKRAALAKSCETAAAKREDYQAAIRFEDEYNALVPVLYKARAELGRAKKRQPRPNVPDEPHGRTTAR